MESAPCRTKQKDESGSECRHNSLLSCKFDGAMELLFLPRIQPVRGKAYFIRPCSPAGTGTS